MIQLRLTFLLALSQVARTLTGCPVLPPQGALDGGLDIPHNEKRLVGYDRSSKKLDAEVLKKYIFGGHVAEYMEEMEEEEPEKYTKHFAKFLEEDISGGDLEDLYAEVRPVAGEKRGLRTSVAGVGKGLWRDSAGGGSRTSSSTAAGSSSSLAVVTISWSAVGGSWRQLQQQGDLGHDVEKPCKCSGSWGPLPAGQPLAHRLGKSRPARLHTSSANPAGRGRAARAAPR